MSGSCAVPLCLPNNCRWDEQTGEYSKTGGERQSLYVVDKALERLRSIKGNLFISLNFRLTFPLVMLPILLLFLALPSIQFSCVIPRVVIDKSRVML